MSNPTIMSQSQHAEVKAEAARLRAMARGLRIQSMAPKPRHDDSSRDPMALAIAADQRAADLERTIAQSNDAERAMLDADLHLARTHTLYAHRTGNIDDMEGAVALERAALMALVAFNQRTIRMVPVTHVRR